MVNKMNRSVKSLKELLFLNTGLSKIRKILKTIQVNHPKDSEILRKISSLLRGFSLLYTEKTEKQRSDLINSLLCLRKEIYEIEYPQIDKILLILKDLNPGLKKLPTVFKSSDKNVKKSESCMDFSKKDPKREFFALCMSIKLGLDPSHPGIACSIESLYEEMRERKITEDYWRDFIKVAMGI